MLNVTPPKNDGTTVYKLNVKNVPVDGFWSVSVYNAAGYFEKNTLQRVFGQQRHRQERTPTARSPSSSAAATAKFRTASRSLRAGMPPCGSIGRAPKS